MDKVQKQLVDTYFRKRKIAVGRNGFEENAEHELFYLIRNNEIDPFTIDVSNIIPVLEKYPQLIDKLNLERLRVHSYYLKYILIHMPQFFDILNEKLDLLSVLTDDDIFEIGEKNPSVLEKLNLKSLAGDELMKVLSKNPEITRALVHNLSTLSQENVDTLLLNEPYLRKYFSEPYLRKYFRNG